MSRLRPYNPIATQVFFDYAPGTDTSADAMKYWISAQMASFDTFQRLSGGSKYAFQAACEGVLERIVIPALDGGDAQAPDLKTADGVGVGSAKGILKTATARKSFFDNGNPRGWKEAVDSLYASVFNPFFNGMASVFCGNMKPSINIVGYAMEPVHYRSQIGPIEQFEGAYNRNDPKSCACQDWNTTYENESPWGNREDISVCILDGIFEDVLQGAGCEQPFQESERIPSGFYDFVPTSVLNDTNATPRTYWSIADLDKGPSWVSPRRSMTPYGVVQSMICAMKYTMFHFGTFIRWWKKSLSDGRKYQLYYNTETGEFGFDELVPEEPVVDEEETSTLYSRAGTKAIGYALVVTYYLEPTEDEYAVDVTEDFEQSIDKYTLLGMTDHVVTDGGDFSILREYITTTPMLDHLNAPTYPSNSVVDSGYFNGHTGNMISSFDKINGGSTEKIVFVDSLSSGNNFEDPLRSHAFNILGNLEIDIDEPVLPELDAGKFSNLIDKISDDIKLGYRKGVNVTESGLCMPAYIKDQNGDYHGFYKDQDDGEWRCQFDIIVNIKDGEDSCLTHELVNEESSEYSTGMGEVKVLGCTSWSWKSMPS